MAADRPGNQGSVLLDLNVAELHRTAAGCRRGAVLRLPRARPCPPSSTATVQGRVLLVRPTYKPHWDVPGGYVEPGESPTSACAREVREELGIEPMLGSLLVVDWAPNAGEGDKMLFIFDGGELAPNQEASIASNQQSCPSTPLPVRSASTRCSFRDSAGDSAWPSTPTATVVPSMQSTVPQPRMPPLDRDRDACPSDLVTLFFPGSRAALGDAGLRAPLRAVLGRPSRSRRAGWASVSCLSPNHTIPLIASSTGRMDSGFRAG